MNSHLEYLEQWFCETSIGCVPKVQIITGLFIVFINLYRLIFQIDFWMKYFQEVLTRV